MTKQKKDHQKRNNTVNKWKIYVKEKIIKINKRSLMQSQARDEFVKK